MKRFFIQFIFLAIIMSVLSFSCSADIEAELLTDGSVKLNFSGSFGEGLKSMISAATDGASFFDTKEIIYELSKSGFTGVKASTDGNSKISISMKDDKKNSYLFSSGILSVKNKSAEKQADKNTSQTLYARLTPANLVNFYKSSDEQIVLLLDLLLAPVFNEEEMTAEEYTDTVAAFYGNTAAAELSTSSLNITIKNPDGIIKKQTVPVVKLLTLSEDLIIQ